MISSREAKIRSFFKENMVTFIICVFVMVLGIVFGIYGSKTIPNENDSSLKDYLNLFLNNVIGKDIDKKGIFVHSIKNNLPILIGVWLLGFSVVGIPIIILINGVKGFTLGFTMGFLINSFGNKGVVLSLVAVLPQNLFYIFSLIIFSVISIRFSMVSMKNKNRRENLLYYTLIMSVFLVIVFLGISIEVYVTPYFIKSVAKGIVV